MKTIDRYYVRIFKQKEGAKMLSENGPKGEFNSLSLCFVSSLFSASAKTNKKSCDTQFLIYYTIP